MAKTKSFTYYLVFGAIVLHLTITPILFSGILLYVQNSYKEQFVDNTRISTSLLANQLSQFDFVQSQDQIKIFFDDLLLGGQLNYVTLNLDNGQRIGPQEFNVDHITFEEDFFFGQHDDQSYFIKVPVSSLGTEVEGFLLLGYDESIVQEHIDTAFSRGIYLGAGYLALTIIVILILVPSSTSSLKLLRDAARKVSSGDSKETLKIKSRITEFSNLADDLEKMRSELVNKKEQIKKRESYISAIMEKMADPMLILDKNLQIDSINPAAQRIFQYTSTELQNKDFLSLISPDCESETCKNLKYYIHAPEGDKPTQCTGLRKDGSTFPVDLSFSKLISYGQEFTICNAHDMTAHKKHEDELITARQEAESANKSKSIFLSSMSHELRTPLNAIIGYSEILLEEAIENEDNSTASDLTKIRNSGSHLLSLINNILDLSKIEAGKMELDIQEFNISHMVEDVIFTTKPLIEKNNNQLDMKFTTDFQVMHADYTKTKQALINLIGNAAKFTSNGKISLEISDKIISNNHFMLLSVTDTGIGIAKEDQSKLFQEFSQANSSVTNNFGGTGLGLAISRKFCQMMGGDITLQSELNKGSTFTISLPVDLSRYQTGTKEPRKNSQ